MLLRPLRAVASSVKFLGQRVKPVLARTTLPQPKVSLARPAFSTAAVISSHAASDLPFGKLRQNLDKYFRVPASEALQVLKEVEENVFEKQSVSWAARLNEVFEHAEKNPEWLDIDTLKNASRLNPLQLAWFDEVLTALSTLAPSNRDELSEIFFEQIFKQKKSKEIDVALLSVRTLISSAKKITSPGEGWAELILELSEHDRLAAVLAAPADEIAKTLKAAVLNLKNFSPQKKSASPESILQHFITHTCFMEQKFLQECSKLNVEQREALNNILDATREHFHPRAYSLNNIFLRYILKSEKLSEIDFALMTVQQFLSEQEKPVADLGAMMRRLNRLEIEGNLTPYLLGQDVKPTVDSSTHLKEAGHFAVSLTDEGAVYHKLDERPANLPQGPR